MQRFIAFCAGCRSAGLNILISDFRLPISCLPCLSCDSWTVSFVFFRPFLIGDSLLNIQDRQNFFQFTIHYQLSVISYLAFLRPIINTVWQPFSLFSARQLPCRSVMITNTISSFKIYKKSKIENRKSVCLRRRQRRSRER